MKGKRQTINVQLGSPVDKKPTRKISVKALVFDKLAIHKTPEEIRRNEGDVYTITHIPTGYAAWRGAAAQRTARLCVKFLLNANIPWDFNRVEDMPKEVAKKAVPIIRFIQGGCRIEDFPGVPMPGGVE